MIINMFMCKNYPRNILMGSIFGTIWGLRPKISKIYPQSWVFFFYWLTLKLHRARGIFSKYKKFDFSFPNILTISFWGRAKIFTIAIIKEHQVRPRVSCGWMGGWTGYQKFLWIIFSCAISIDTITVKIYICKRSNNFFLGFKFGYSWGPGQKLENHPQRLTFWILLCSLHRNVTA